MIEAIGEFRGTKFAEDGSRIEVCATVFRPQRDEESIAFYCVVRCPHIFDNDKKIFGVDADQATELALMFVPMMFGHHEIEIEDET